MGLTNKAIRFSQAVGLATLIASYPSASAHAGSKIFKTTDSHGNVTFTDVPLLLESRQLEPRLKSGLECPAKLTLGQQNKPLREKFFEPGKDSEYQRCLHKPD